MKVLQKARLRFLNSVFTKAGTRKVSAFLFSLISVFTYLGITSLGVTHLAYAADSNQLTHSPILHQSSDLTVYGNPTQGGMIIGRSTKPIDKVTIDGVKVPVHPNQTLFVFGFGRDAEPDSELNLVYADTTQFSLPITVVQRDYKIDRVNGVAQKYVSPPASVTKRTKREAAAVYQARQNMTFRTDFSMPIQRPAEGRISGVYGSQRVFNGVPKRPHFGLDIAAPTGTKVNAPWPGKVVFADPDLYYSGGTLIIDHGMGITSTYIHLSKLDVKRGDEIQQGQKIAEIGATGRVTGPHLDWRINWFNRRLDPGLLMPEILP